MLTHVNAQMIKGVIVGNFGKVDNFGTTKDVLRSVEKPPRPAGGTPLLKEEGGEYC